MSDLIKREDAIAIIDSVMNNREIDSIRNAILAIRDQVVDMKCVKCADAFEPIETDYAKLRIRDNNPPCLFGNGWYDGAEYIVVDMNYKLDSHLYGAYWYIGGDKNDGPY